LAARHPRPMRPGTHRPTLPQAGPIRPAIPHARNRQPHPH
jgi:hypothetical protein